MSEGKKRFAVCGSQDPHFFEITPGSELAKRYDEQFGDQSGCYLLLEPDGCPRCLEEDLHYLRQEYRMCSDAGCSRDTGLPPMPLCQDCYLGEIKEANCKLEAISGLRLLPPEPVTAEPMEAHV